MTPAHPPATPPAHPAACPSNERFLIMRPRWFIGFVATIILVTTVFAGTVAAALAFGYMTEVLLGLAGLLVLCLLLYALSIAVIPGYFGWHRLRGRIGRARTDRS